MVRQLLLEVNAGIPTPDPEASEKKYINWIYGHRMRYTMELFDRCVCCEIHGGFFSSSFSRVCRKKASSCSCSSSSRGWSHLDFPDLQNPPLSPPSFLRCSPLPCQFHPFFNSIFIIFSTPSLQFVSTFLQAHQPVSFFLHSSQCQFPSFIYTPSPHVSSKNTWFYSKFCPPFQQGTHFSRIPSSRYSMSYLRHVFSVISRINDTKSKTRIFNQPYSYNIKFTLPGLMNSIQEFT